MSFIEITLNDGEKIYFRKAEENYISLIKRKNKQDQICAFSGRKIISYFDNTEIGIGEMINYIVQNYHLDISVYIPP